MIRGVLVAGCLLRKLGNEVDLGFLGSEKMDSHVNEKKRFAEALLDAAETMEMMNYIINELVQK